MDVWPKVDMRCKELITKYIHIWIPASLQFHPSPFAQMINQIVKNLQKHNNHQKIIIVITITRLFIIGIFINIFISFCSKIASLWLPKTM